MAAEAPFRSAVYEGRVMHRRLKPVGHRLVYQVFSFLLDLDELDRLDRDLAHFSRGRFNLFSLHDADYGAGAPADIAAYVRALAAANGIDAAGPLQLLCYPRMLGYAFNPLTVYYLHDAAGAVSAVLYEVRNTFGGKHSYLIPADGAAGDVRQEADKLFHVSPFMEMATRYHFRLTPPGERLTLAIRQTDAEGAVMNAVFTGERRAISDAALRRCFFGYPLMTVKVIAGIHYEALKLFLKGMKLRPGAPDPAHPVTLVARPPRPARAAAMA